MSEMAEQSGAGNGAPTATPDEVREAVRVVIDPELGISVVDLGLVYDIQVEDHGCTITYTLTAMGCPVGPMIEEQFRAIVTSLPGIEQVSCTMVFDPPWSPERMSEDARAALGMF